MNDNINPEDQELWNELGKLEYPDTPPVDEEGETFQIRLAAYNDGYEDGLAAQQTTRESKITPFSKGLLNTWAIAACFVMVSFFGGIQFQRTSEDTSNLKAELSSIREMMVINLLEEGSVSRRMDGLHKANLWLEPGETKGELLLNTLANDPSTSVKLTALDSLSTYLSSKQVRLELADICLQLNAPVVQFGILQSLIEYGESTEYIPVADALKAQGKNRVIIDRMLNSTI